MMELDRSPFEIFPPRTLGFREFLVFSGLGRSGFNAEVEKHPKFQ